MNVDAQVRQPVLFGLVDALPSSPFLNSEQICQKLGTNVGNLAFVHAIKHQLVGLAERANLSWNSTPEQIREAGDICVIPCANQFGHHHDLGQLATRIESIPNPFVAIGLGAQSGLDMKIPEVPEGTVRWLRRIAERAPCEKSNVAVRGEFSRRVLEAYGFVDACVTGCPSLFLNPSRTLGQTILGRTVGLPQHVAVAAGHPGWQHLSRIERSLAQIVTATNGAYVCQSPFESVRMGRGEIDALEADDLDRCRRYVDRDLTTDEFKIWARRHAVVFFNVPGWMEFLRRFDFVVGTRIHGTALGLQAGVPALCVVWDSRTLELCQTMQVPHVMARDYLDGIKLKQLSGLFRDQFDPAQFDLNRRALAKSYREFLEGNGLTITEDLKRLAN